MRPWHEHRHHAAHRRRPWHRHRHPTTLRRRIFLWFGASIVLTGILVALTMHLVGGNSGWQKELAGLQSFIAEEFAPVWPDPGARTNLALRVQRDFQLDVELLDANGQSLGPSTCTQHAFEVPVGSPTSGQPNLGRVRFCGSPFNPQPWRVLLALSIGALVLWRASGRVSRTVLRPLQEVVRVAEEIGDGNLSSRADVSCVYGEERILGESLNRMAGRIERQMHDQRELLASVSHELRTPLGHIRILLELARQNGADAKTLDELELEVGEVDKLVGNLLASSRLDFGAVDLRALDAREVALRALERAGLDAALLVAPEGPLPFKGDATLIARALANLLDNATRHAGAVTSLTIEVPPGRVSFAVEDRGPGLPQGEEERAFEAFFHRPTGREKEASGLGLGLALVKRISEAHHGSVFAVNRPEGGARVGLELPIG